MVTRKATIKREEAQTSLILEGTGQSYTIALTEDNPNNVKGVFNSLLQELKAGMFEYKLEDESTDLYNNICKEYLVQLNSELRSVFDELEAYQLLNA